MRTASSASVNSPLSINAETRARDRGEFRPVVSQPSKVGAKLDQFLGRPIEASRDIGEGRVRLAQLLQYFAKRRVLDAFFLHYGTQDFGLVAISNG